MLTNACHKPPAPILLIACCASCSVVPGVDAVSHLHGWPEARQAELLPCGRQCDSGVCGDWLVQVIVDVDARGHAGWRTGTQSRPDTEGVDVRGAERCGRSLHAA